MPWSGNRILRADIVRNETGTATVRLAGEIDLTSVDVVRRAVGPLEAGTGRIILDLSLVTSCDVAGSRLLAEIRLRAIAAGTDVIVRYPQHAVYRVLELTGALPLVCPDLAGARVLAFDAAAAACETAVLEAIRASGAEKGTAQLVDSETGALRIVAQRGFERPFLDFFETVDQAKSACGAALVTGRPVWVTDVARSPVFPRPAVEVMLAAGARAVGSVPVRAHEGGDVLAMLSVHRPQPTVWTQRQRRQLAAVAAVTGRALSTAG